MVIGSNLYGDYVFYHGIVAGWLKPPFEANKVHVIFPFIIIVNLIVLWRSNRFLQFTERTVFNEAIFRLTNWTSSHNMWYRC